MSKVTVMQCDRCGAQHSPDVTLASLTLAPPSKGRGRKPAPSTWDVCQDCEALFAVWVANEPAPADS